MKLKNLWIITMMLSSLFLIATFSVEAADETIMDGAGDVSSVDYLTGETNVITNSPDIDVDNLDLIQATYTQQGIQATLSLQVKGIIENRGKIIDPNSEDILNSINAVEYLFELTTSDQDYSLTYSNQTGQLTKGYEQINLTSSDFTVVGNTLTITFSLMNASETYENLSVMSTFIKVDLSTMDTDSASLVYLQDIAPNPSLEIYEAYASNIGSVGETIQFNATVAPFTGQPPYNYHWNFGDEGSSTELSPTHIYNKAGTYTYTFSVTDQAGGSASQTGTITISSEGGSSGGSLSNQMILFIAILLIIIVIGVVVIVWVIRR